MPYIETLRNMLTPFGGIGNPLLGSTGGTITTAGGYRIHTFTTVGNSTFTPSGAGTVEYLIVASGASTPENQGNARWGGGGAGGLLSGSSAVSAQNYTISVGASVTGGDYGNNSTALGLTAIRGARGANFDSQYLTGIVGGSGGGAWYPDGIPGGLGTPGQGYPGGPAGSTPPYGGGGGGAGSAGRGKDYDGASGNNGGDGLSSSISGSSVIYAAGSRCSIYGNTGFSVTASTYGGGAGGGGTSGQGIVIVRYPI